VYTSLCVGLVYVDSFSLCHDQKKIVIIFSLPVKAFQFLN
jgi:hypothetical protein